jgi:hypothetical protein
MRYFGLAAPLHRAPPTRIHVAASPSLAQPESRKAKPLMLLDIRQRFHLMRGEMV